ncbi:MAG: hypothetical protein P8O82_03115, partial [Schleiferiaceae bacterium]|nr:hypothetical protein [Schleiferiaceae bacterium]
IRICTRLKIKVSANRVKSSNKALSENAVIELERLGDKYTPQKSMLNVGVKRAIQFVSCKPSVI